MSLEALISFIIASLALTISPGPDIIYVLMQSISHGKRDGIATALGLVSGIIIHTTLVAFGVSTIITNSPNVFFAIKIVGSIYLFYLAYKVYKSPANITLTQDNVPKKAAKQLFWQGFLMNVLNPKVTLFFLSFLPGFLFSDTLDPVIQFYILGALFMIQALFVFVTVSYVSGGLMKYLKNNNSVGYVLKYLQIIVFVGIAIFILR